jgi:hypothetical protein
VREIFAKIQVNKKMKFKKNIKRVGMKGKVKQITKKRIKFLTEKLHIMYL